MSSYQSQNLNSPSEINVIPAGRITSNPLEEEVEVNPELIRIIFPAEESCRNFEAPTEQVLRRKVKRNMKKKLKKLKKMDYWLEGNFLRLRESNKRFVKSWICFANPWISIVSWSRILTPKRFDPCLYKTNSDSGC